MQHTGTLGRHLVARGRRGARVARFDATKRWDAIVPPAPVLASRRACDLPAQDWIPSWGGSTVRSENRGPRTTSFLNRQVRHRPGSCVDPRSIGRCDDSHEWILRKDRTRIPGLRHEGGWKQGRERQNHEHGQESTGNTNRTSRPIICHEHKMSDSPSLVVSPASLAFIIEPDDPAPQPCSSPHAAAQARYRAKNADTEKEKAKLRMRRLREARKAAKEAASTTDECERNERGETYEEFMARECRELRARPSPEFREFSEFCNRVKVLHLRCNWDDPQEVADLEDFFNKHQNPCPCAEDLPPYLDDYVECLWHIREVNYPEWKEELLDFRDFLAETTPEELDRRQLAAQRKFGTRMIIGARGGF
ncbi:hypothetical protein C8R44DRAFT_745811 [Mycena epipterygia]|nr:hypothetical protein C8R44DRAFT_745811 [Mycena epipterygia]